MKTIIVALSALSLLAGSSAVTGAAPKVCRNAQGHFIKCPQHAAAPARCRNGQGHFVKCGTKGARPA
jgi:hypothetical protein